MMQDSRTAVTYYSGVDVDTIHPDSDVKTQMRQRHSIDCDEPDSVPDGLRGCCSEDHQPVIQERAWTSPIWYTP